MLLHLRIRRPHSKRNDRSYRGVGHCCWRRDRRRKRSILDDAPMEERLLCARLHAFKAGMVRPLLSAVADRRRGNLRAAVVDANDGLDLPAASTTPDDEMPSLRTRSARCVLPVASRTLLPVWGMAWCSDR